MSKTKNKNHSELEHLRGQLKAIISENRQLKRKLKQLERREHFFEEGVVEVAEAVNMDLCHNCGKGVLQVLDIKHVQFITCNLCSYKKKVLNGTEAKKTK